MAHAKSTGALAQYGPVMAPLIGIVLALIFIGAAVGTSSIPEATEKLSSTVSQVRKQLDSDEVVPSQDPIPLADNVTAALVPGPGDNWKAHPGSEKLLELPIMWAVVMDGPKPDQFSQIDEDGDEKWNPREWGNTDYPSDPGERGKFENWDRDKDGFISRKEYEDPPTNNREQFDALDKNGDGYLKADDGEISAEDEYEWDRYPFKDGIDFSEFERRYDPKDEVDLGTVSNVQAKVDPATMQIVVTWDDPALETMPKDIAFMIERRAPQTVARRMSEWRKKVQEANEKLRAWESRFEKWWNVAPAEGQKSNKQLFPRKQDAEREFAKSDPKPIQPPQPSEWEPVTAQPVTGNEYRDNSFELDVTYTYAVYMATKANPKRGQTARVDESLPGWFLFPDSVPSDGHPVIVRNRVELKWSGSTPPNGTIALVTWHKLTENEGTENEVNNWYRVQISESFGPDNPTVGGKFRMAELKSRDVKMFDAAGTEVNAAEILPPDTEIDFSTGFSFVTASGRGFLLNSRELGDFELPKATQQNAAPDVPASGENALEVRCLAVKSGGKEGTFELTRWVRAGEEWLRVIWTGSVSSGKQVGGEVSLESPGSGVTVYDATGNQVRAADLKKYGELGIDMNAGSFDGLKDRTVTVGGSDFDLFGTLYKD